MEMQDFASWWVMTYLKIWPHTCQMGLFWPKKAYLGDGKYTLLLYECLLFHFMSSNCQKCQICKGSTSKHEVHKEVQTEFETSNFFKGRLWLLICCFSLVTAT